MTRQDLGRVARVSGDERSRLEAREFGRNRTSVESPSLLAPLAFREHCVELKSLRWIWQ